MALTGDAKNRAMKWFRQGERGASSETMCLIALELEWLIRHPCAPLDPSDFRRCFALMQQVPEIRNYFPEIGVLVPSFKPLLANWDELTALYKEEYKTGRCPKLYDRMQELRGEANA